MNQYDLLIIGGGPAGLTAGLYAARARLKTLLVERRGCGGQSVITDLIENYPGFPGGISGYELSAKLEEQARSFGLEIRLEEVKAMAAGEHGAHTVTTSEGEYRAPAVIIASGADYRMLGVPGEESFCGRGVSYCATCDGPFFRDKDVAVVGGGDSALQEALFLTRFARTVTVIHRREHFRAAKILQERVACNEKIKLLKNTVVTGISGKETVESVMVKDVRSNDPRTIDVQGVFVFVGWNPNTGYLPKSLARNDIGYIVTDDSMATSVAGVFACGDVRKKLLRQVVTACGDGAVAAFAAQEYIDTFRGNVSCTPGKHGS